MISHQLAHQIIGGSTASSYLKKEAQADQLGIQLTARAGYDPFAAPDFWERVAMEHPWSIVFGKGEGWRQEPPHGRMGERLTAIRAALQEIREGEDALPRLPSR